jgi:S-DNA-T family DNA segregation ATPase FtsK/SpoIIIE
MPNEDENRKNKFKSRASIEKIWSKFEDGVIDSKFRIPLGKNEEKKDVCLDLDSASHIFASGDTWSGVWMFRDVILATLVKFNKPDDPKLIVIDPGGHYFTNFKDIDSHLVFPIITEPYKTFRALEWAKKESTRRFDLLTEDKVRNINDYNLNHQDNIIPKIVIIITSLEELIRYDRKKTESLIVGTASKVKATGIHFIITTNDSPKADTISGLILANMPTRIAFRTNTEEESLLILNKAGAEKLVGNGEMLVDYVSNTELEKLHAYHISEKDIGKLVPST